jgi:1-acyl-sn-glycerol-3-phosphate acyltransferase
MAHVMNKVAASVTSNGRTEPGAEPTLSDMARAGLYVRVFRLAVRGLLRLFFRVRVRGLKNLPGTPVIVCPNHLGWSDPFMILCFLPVEPRLYALGYSLDYVPDEGARAFRARVVNSLNVMIQLRMDRPIEAVRVMRDVIRRGGSLLIFPEATSMGAKEGVIQPFQEGAAHLSILTGTPIIPVGITGTRDLWLRRPITIRIGKALFPGDFQGNTHERMDAMTTRLETEVKALLPGDRSHARVKLLRNWLNGLFYGEEHFEHRTHRSRMQPASGQQQSRNDKI